MFKFHGSVSRRTWASDQAANSRVRGSRVLLKTSTLKVKKLLSLLQINFKKKNKRTGAFCYDAAASTGLFRLSQMTSWALLCLAFDWDFGKREEEKKR